MVFSITTIIKMPPKNTNFTKLRPSDYENITSPYLSGEKKHEEWILGDICIDKNILSTTIFMKNYYVPKIADSTFHLSFITALEFTSQLSIVYLHHWAQLSHKTQEVWLVKSSCEVVRPIVNSNCFQVTMKADSIRKLYSKIYATLNFHITDDQDGLMIISLTGLMQI